MIPVLIVLLSLLSLAYVGHILRLPYRPEMVLIAPVVAAGATFKHQLLDWEGLV